MMNVLYMNDCLWEFDYFKYDIFRSLLDITVVSKYSIKPYLQNPVYKKNTILILNSTITPFSDAKAYCKALRPHALFQLSDEHGTRQDWLTLSEYCRYVFRQYTHASYKITGYKNIFQIPLGYPSGMLGSSSLDLVQLPMKDRSYEWAFIGCIKSDRHEMCTKFSTAFKKGYCAVGHNTWKLNEQRVAPKEMAKIYADSVFVPIGFGNHTYDCFRFYEAIIGGAIPVLVGKPEDLDMTFFFRGLKPCYIQSTTWDGAIEQCLNKPVEDLQVIQDHNSKWWKEQMESIQNKLSSAK